MRVCGSFSLCVCLCVGFFFFFFFFFAYLDIPCNFLSKIFHTLPVTRTWGRSGIGIKIVPRSGVTRFLV